MWTSDTLLGEGSKDQRWQRKERGRGHARLAGEEAALLLKHRKLRVVFSRCWEIQRMTECERAPGGKTSTGKMLVLHQGPPPHGHMVPGTFLMRSAGGTTGPKGNSQPGFHLNPVGRKTRLERHHFRTGSGPGLVGWWGPTGQNQEPDQNPSLEKLS